MPDESTLELADRLHSTAIHVLRRVRRHDEEAGITPARLSALSVLVFGGPKTLGDLARAEQVRAPTMSRTVSWLEDAGLVHRETDPDDARALTLTATESGVRVMEEARRRRVASLADDLGTLSPTELAALGSGVAALRRLLELAPRRPTPKPMRPAEAPVGTSSSPAPTPAAPGPSRRDWRVW